MIENKYIRTSAEIALTVAFIISLGVIITHEDTANNIYTCDGQDIYCFKLSKVNADGAQTRCYYNKEFPRNYKNCVTGWEKISLLDVIADPQTLEETLQSTSSIKVWDCSTKECIRKK